MVAERGSTVVWFGVFLTSLTLKTSPMSEATEFQGNPLEEKAPKSNVTGGISVGQVDKNLERIKLPKDKSTRVNSKVFGQLLKVSWTKPMNRPSTK